MVEMDVFWTKYLRNCTTRWEARQHWCWVTPMPKLGRKEYLQRSGLLRITGAFYQSQPIERWEREKRLWTKSHQNEITKLTLRTFFTTPHSSQASFVSLNLIQNTARFVGCNVGVNGSLHDSTQHAGHFLHISGIAGCACVCVAAVAGAGKRATRLKQRAGSKPTGVSQPAPAPARDRC